MEYDKQNTNYAKKKPSTPTKYQVRQPKYQVRQPKIYAVLLRGNFCRNFTHFFQAQNMVAYQKGQISGMQISLNKKIR